MMKRRLVRFLLLFVLPLAIYATVDKKEKDVKKRRTRMEQMMNELQDSDYESVKQEDLLADEVYIKLARDGWNSDEIKSIMNDYLKSNRSRVRGSFEYGMYAKQWLPSYGFIPGGDTIYQFVDTAYNEKIYKSVRQLYSADMTQYYEQIPYTPDDRLSGVRNKGYFRPVLQKPNSGRIHWIVVNPANEDALMVIPDGAGIFRTSDLGKTWDCVTDRIPDREFRKTAYHSAIPVDPDDWNHFFAFMKNGNETRVYETMDGGLSWTRVEGATHKNFKRGYGFRDSAGNMKFIGAVQVSAANYMNNQLWISEDKGVNWTRILLPDSIQGTHPETGVKGAFLQNFAFDPTDRDKIYFTSSRSIYYFDDGAKAYDNNGTKEYHVKRMRFNVYGQDGVTLRAANTAEFPYAMTSQGFLEINPNNPLQMWFAAASRNVSYGVYSAVYRSDDGGKNWITLQEPYNKIGSGLAFGNESPWGWLGGFGVNFTDTTKLYGCSMSSAISTDGGRKFSEYAWANRLLAQYDDGNYYYTTSSRHNADNHCIVSHPSGRVFRGSDSGLLMIDPNINGGKWTNINGSMGNQLHYSIKVNEFGDQTMLGNTQDVDAQTYKYGRWGNWRGYEGTEAFINPYSGTCYFSGGGGGSIDNVELSSWREGYTMADVCTDSWYLIHNPGDNSKCFFRIDDYGRKTVNLSQNTVDVTGNGVGARDFAITRDGDKPTLFVMNTNHTIVRSTDNGNTFQTVEVLSNGKKVPAKFTNALIAADPDNSNGIYIGQTGKVFYYDLTTGEVQDLSAGLPSVACNDLIFHEGSGDLYFFSKSGGLYLRDHETGTWSLWQKGYNPIHIGGSAIINYTTQEMVICDYGRGVWVADLEHPSDRYFKNGFGLKEISNVDGRRTIGIDTKWNIPLYYNYTWYVNGVDVQNPYQYLTARLSKGDKVKLVITLRESPDVSTTSAEYVVGESVPSTVSLASGSALYSDGSGRIDLGNVDYFFNDFTIDMWVKPESNGVILCNRPVELQKDTRGWAIMVNGGVLKFRYAPANLFDRATYDENVDQQNDLTGSAVKFGEWIHVAVSEDRDGNVNLYMDGKLVDSKKRIVEWSSLNSAVNLSLFADGFESMAIKGAVDELKIWNYPLSETEVRRAMFSHRADNVDGLVYYNDFNAGNLAAEKEYFSGYVMKPKTNAVTSYVDMPVAVAADRAAMAVLSGKTSFEDGGNTILTIIPSGTVTAETGAYEYEGAANEMPGINTKYYTPVSSVYQVRMFDEVEQSEMVRIEIPFAADAGKQYQLYACDLKSDSKVWMKMANLTRMDASTVSADNISLASLQDKVFVILQNNAAIEPSVLSENNANEITVYDEDDNIIELEANLVGGLEEPVGVYEITSEKGILKVMDNLKFINNKAVTRLYIDMDSVRNHDVVSDVVRGKNDDLMIPVEISIRNKMLPKDMGNAVQIVNGGLQVGSSDVYGKINNSNNVTMMGWVRIDDASVLSGVKPLIFFRGGSSSPTGIHLSNGNLRCHWNDGMYGKATYLNIKQQDLGRWMHVALIVAPTKLYLLLNGVENHFTMNMAPARIGSPLMLGQNYSGDKWFNGAFDQVSIWNRALSLDEVRYYMQNTPRMNEEGLVGYIDMDHYDANGNIVEVLTGTTLTKYGTVTTGIASTAPYNVKQILNQEAYAAEAGQMIHVAQVAGKGSNCQFTVLDGTSYNYVSESHPELYPLVKEHYTLLYEVQTSFTASDNVTMTFNMPQITSVGKVWLAIRPLGSDGEFTSYIESSAVSEGKVQFTVPGNVVSSPVEMMLMIDSTEGERPVKVSMSLDTVQDGDTVVLDAITDQIKIKATVLSCNANSHVEIAVTETSYAAPDRESLDVVNNSEETFAIKIDKEALNKLGVNPLTVKLTGVSEPVELKLNVVLEPIVQLELADDADSDALVIDSPYSSFAVKARLLQGILPDGVNIVTETEAGTMINTGMGSLVSNNNVTISDNLEFYKGRSEADEGWNLVGNPYLSNINMTKEQNVVIDESFIVKYMYQYNPESDTYTAWDMVENYDETQKLSPFQPFFIQTKQEGASLVITPEAKSTTVNRRVLDHFMMKESHIVRIGLYQGDSEKMSDRTEIRVQRDTESGFAVGEDALKMWGGVNSKANEIATSADGRYMSVNVMPDSDVEIPVFLRLNATGKFRMAVFSAMGMGTEDEVILTDRKTGTTWNLLDGDGYEFTADQKGDISDRFVVSVKLGDTSGIEDTESSLYVSVDGNDCTVNNLTGAGVIEVFDTAGRRIIFAKAEGPSYTMSLNSGNYIVRVRMSDKDYTTKINVR